jgi:stalled ribosome rescue protein Dom34
MSAYVVWMDSTNAKIFHIEGDNIDSSKAFRHDHDHHTENKNDSKHKDSPRFFLEVADHLKEGKDSVLLVGPAYLKAIS